MRIEKLEDNIEVKREKLREACKEFEAIFIEYMLKVMRRSIPKSNLFKRELSEEIYTSLFDEKIAEEVAKVKGLGIGDMLYKELSRLIPDRTDKNK